MEKEFVPYVLAVKLKSLGFDEECFGFYNPTVTEKVIMNNDSYGGYGLSYEHIVVAPTFSQAFRWFREKHNLHCAVNTHTSSTNQLTYICSLEFGKKLTYEEAELACLDKLIEIVESKSAQNSNDGRTMEKLIESNRKFDEKNNPNIKYDSSDRNEDMPNITNFFI